VARLLIVGLDGLDPDLVERWGMDWFRQRAWGMHFVGFFKRLHTPILWASFVTGVNVEERGFDMEFIHESRQRRFWGKLYPLYMLRLMVTRRPLGIRRLLAKLGMIPSDRLYYSPNMPPGLRELSFVEELRRGGYMVATVEVPGFDEVRNEFFRSMVWEYVRKPFKERMELVEHSLRETRERIERASRFVASGYDMVFVYSMLPDLAMHMATKPTLTARLWLRNLHRRLYKVIEDLLRFANSRDYYILIVSDHGFDIEDYDHSPYGFWSMNVEPPSWWRIETILDFKENIIRLVAGDEA